jgi:cell division protein FtsB
VPRSKRPATRAVKRKKAEKGGLSAAGRSRLILLGATVLSAVILVAWFPASALYSQRSSLASTNSELRALHQQETALTQERKNLSQSGEITRVAREQYQLVSPGQQAYQVLPPSGTASSNTPGTGDTGMGIPVTPSASVELPPGTTTTVPGHDSTGATPARGSKHAAGTLSRMLQDLEFWR